LAILVAYGLHNYVRRTPDKLTLLKYFSNFLHRKSSALKFVLLVCHVLVVSLQKFYYSMTYAFCLASFFPEKIDAVLDG
jgi:hypothetical protein